MVPKKLPAEFDVASAASITGVSAIAQRRWRMEGLIPPNEAGKHGQKHARFGIAEVARMFVLRRLIEKRPTLFDSSGGASSAVSQILNRLGLSRTESSVVAADSKRYVVEIEGNTVAVNTIEEVNEVMAARGVDACKLIDVDAMAGQLLDRINGVEAESE